MRNFIAKLVEMGGNEWKKGDHHRVYFNNANKLIGLSINKYNTGNVSSATLDGEKISNSYAKTIADEKVYFDVNAKTWVSPINNQEVLKLISVEIEAEAEAEVVAEEVSEEEAAETVESGIIETRSTESGEEQCPFAQTKKLFGESFLTEKSVLIDRYIDKKFVSFGGFPLKNGQAIAFFDDEETFTASLLEDWSAFERVASVGGFRSDLNVQRAALQSLGLMA